MAKRGEVDEFIWVLAIALILIIAVGIFSFFVPYTGPLTNITISSFSPGQVGFVQDFVARTINLQSFTVGEPQTENLKTWPQLEISQGLFGGQLEKGSVAVPDYLMETARGVTLSFNIYDTNNYGNLVIKWNGRDIMNRAHSAGRYDIFIEKEHVKESNSIEISSTGPGFFFWASSVYIIKNFNVNLEYGPQRVIPFELLPSEMQQFDRVEISSYTSGTGTLVIKINGVPIFSGQPVGVFRKSFNLFQAPIKSGQNILTFVDEDGTYVMRDTAFNVYTRGDQSVARHKFNLTEENFNFLANSIFRGKVDYRVRNIARQGGVEIKINGHQLSTNPPRVGWNSASFTANIVDIGENEITFGGTGSFDISEVIVGLER